MQRVNLLYLMLHKLHAILSKKKLQYLNFKTWCEILSTTHVLASSCIDQYFITYIYKEWDIDYSTGVESGWLCSTCRSNFIFRDSVSYTSECKLYKGGTKTMKTIMISHFSFILMMDVVNKPILHFWYSIHLNFHMTMIEGELLYNQ